VIIVSGFGTFRDPPPSGPRRGPNLLWNRPDVSKGSVVFSTRSATRIALVSAGAATIALVGVAASTGAQAASGVFVYQTSGGAQQSIPFPAENQCYPTPNAAGAMNYTAGDAYIYTDSHCTIGKDAGNVPRFDKSTVGFNSVVIRTSN
jgi:hypothetical protein